MSDGQRCGDHRIEAARRLSLDPMNFIEIRLRIGLVAHQIFDLT